MTTTKFHNLLRNVFAGENGDVFDLPGIAYREDWQISAINSPCAIASVSLDENEEVAPRNHTATATVSFELRLPYEDYSDAEARTVAETFHRTLETRMLARTGNDDCFCYTWKWQATDAATQDIETRDRIFSVRYTAIVQY